MELGFLTSFSNNEKKSRFNGTHFISVLARKRKLVQLICMNSIVLLSSFNFQTDRSLVEHDLQIITVFQNRVPNSCTFSGSYKALLLNQVPGI